MAPRNLGASVLEAYKDESSSDNKAVVADTNNVTNNMSRDEEDTIKKMKQNVQKATTTTDHNGFTNSREEINDKSRRLIQSCLSHLDTNLNVLVLGGKNSGEN